MMLTKLRTWLAWVAIYRELYDVTVQPVTAYEVPVGPRKRKKRKK
jgi:hypothetical protein